MSIAIIYTRVSTVEQAEKQSLDNQENICREFAARRNLEVEKVFVEAGESAKTANRTQLLEMIRYCQLAKARIKYIIVYKLDRFARNAEDHLTLKSMFLKLGIQLLSATELIENTTTGKLMEVILSGFSEFDNSVRAERSRGGMKTRVEQGCWVHAGPVGYKNIKDSQKRPTLEPDHMAPAVTAFLKEFAKGLYTQKQAVKVAHRYGIMTKPGKRKDGTPRPSKPISANGVYRLLRNPIYCGQVESSMMTGQVQGIHPPLITPEEHLTILAILDGRKRTLQPSPRNKDGWPLRGFITCFNCGHPLTGSTSRGRNASYSYYHCVKCKGRVRIQRDAAHTQFKALLARVGPSSSSLRLFREIVLRRWDKEYRTVQQERRKLDDQIRDCEDTKNALVDKVVTGVFDDDTYKHQADRLAVRKAELELARSELHEGEVEKEQIVDSCINFMANAGELWATADTQNQQRFQRMVFPSGLSCKYANGFGTAQMGECYKEIQLEQAQNEKAADNDAAAFDNNNTLVVPRGFEPLLPA